MRAIGLLMGCLLLLAAMQSSYVVVQARSGRKVDAHGHHSTNGQHHKAKEHVPKGELHGNRSQPIKGPNPPSSSIHAYLSLTGKHSQLIDIDPDFQVTNSPEISHHLKTPDNEHMSPTQTGKQHQDPFQVHISIERVHPLKDKYKPNSDAHQQEIHKDIARDKKKGHHQQCVEDTDCPQGECCLQIWTGEKVCKRGNYKMANHHCINSCICSPGLECVHHRHNHPKVTDRHTLGRCQLKKTQHHHHHKQADKPSR